MTPPLRCCPVCGSPLPGKGSAAEDLCMACLLRESLADLGRAHRLLEKQIPLPGKRDLRGWKWYHLWMATRSDELFHFERHEGWVRRVRFIPGTDAVVSADTRTLTFWNLSSKECIATFEQPTDSRGLEVTHDGRLLFYGCLGEVLNVWELSPVPRLRSTHAMGQVWGMALSSDDQVLAGGWARSEVRCRVAPKKPYQVSSSWRSFGAALSSGQAKSKIWRL